jgi:hypothetical protein
VAVARLCFDKIPLSQCGVALTGTPFEINSKQHRPIEDKLMFKFQKPSGFSGAHSIHKFGPLVISGPELKNFYLYQLID